MYVAIYDISHHAFMALHTFKLILHDYSQHPLKCHLQSYQLICEMNAEKSLSQFQIIQVVK